MQWCCSVLLEELKSKKVLVQHVDTVVSTEATVDIVQSFMVSAVINMLVICVTILSLSFAYVRVRFLNITCLVSWPFSCQHSC